MVNWILRLEGVLLAFSIILNGFATIIINKTLKIQSERISKLEEKINKKS